MTGVPSLPEGVLAAHHTDALRGTGCTVFLFEKGARAAFHRVGPATATRHMDSFCAAGADRLLHGLVLTGGSAFGLACTNGVMRVLRQRGVGVATRGGPVPRVPGAVIFDLSSGDADAWPSEADAEAAARRAKSEPLAEGRVGVGTGALVGKALGPAHASPGGFAWRVARVGDALVGVYVVVNAFGDVIDPASGCVLAGCSVDEPEGRRFLGPEAYRGLTGLDPEPASEESTTLAVVLTDAGLSASELRYVAQVAGQAVVRVIWPVATPFDGDLVFACSTGARAADPVSVAFAAERLLRLAIPRAVACGAGAGA